MKKQDQKHIVSIDRFDQEVSLYQLVPPGTGRGLSHLKTIVDSILYNPEQQPRKPLSLLVIGKQGAKTCGRAFLRALALDEINETPAQLLHSQTIIHEFFKPLFMPQGYLVSDINYLYPSAIKTLYQIISKGEYSGCESYRKAQEIVCVYCPVVMTARDLDKIPDYFKEQISHIVSMDDYSEEQKFLICLQRLRYCGIDYEEEEVLSLLVKYGCGDLHQVIRLLKDSITVVMAENRSVLTVSDVKKAVGYM